MNKHNEHILAVKPSDFIKEINGFIYYNNLGFLSSYDLIFGHRAILEEDTRYKQIIPYVLVKYDNKYLVYSRNKKGGESRLHDKLSIGFGGHINLQDNQDSSSSIIDLQYCIENCIIRELEEELGWDICSDESLSNLKLLGVLNLNETDVDKVHLGLVYEVEFKHNPDRLIEDCISLVGFMNKEELYTVEDSMEEWSKEVIKSLTKV